MSSDFGDFQKNWSELSKDVDKINKYTAIHQNVKLESIKIENLDIDGVIFNDAKFSGIEWEKTTSKKSTLTKVMFDKCKFTQTDFSYSTFTDVLFKDCEFVDSDINRSKFINVKFENCRFLQMSLVENDGDRLIFVNCHLLNSGMGGGSIDFEITDCILDGVDVSTAKGGHQVLIEGGLLSEVDFGDSNFSTVTLRRVKQGEGPVRFNGSTAEGIRIEDAEMARGLSLAEVTAGFVSIEGGRLNTAFSNSSIPKIYLRKVRPCAVSIHNAKLQSISMIDCEIENFQLWGGYVDEMLVQNSTIDKSYSKNFKANIVVWDNVTLAGKIELTNAQINDFRPHRITRGPKLNLITTGSNLKF